MKILKNVLSIMLYIVAFVWMSYTFYSLWGDVTRWKEGIISGVDMLLHIALMAIENIVTAILLWIACKLWEN